MVKEILDSKLINQNKSEQKCSVSAKPKAQERDGAPEYQRQECASSVQAQGQVSELKANRLHIGIFGDTNAGKSTLINLLTDQKTSLVSPVRGTTTDPVYKAMELPGVGASMLIDTAGFDDNSELGSKRMERTGKVLDECDIYIYVEREKKNPELISILEARRKPLIKVDNRIGISAAKAAKMETKPKSRNMAKHACDNAGAEDKICDESKTSGISSAAARDDYILFEKDAILRAIREAAKEIGEDSPLLDGLLSGGESVLLVMPQDIQAPKGRLILPQVQTIRALLDLGCSIASCKTDDLERTLALLKAPPQLIITDSQVFSEVYALKPDESDITSFSILMARAKGDISELVKGAEAIDGLNEKSRVLISEACTHAPLEEDIGRVKIPALLRKRYGDMKIDFSRGLDFPGNLDYDLIIMCGSCMFNRAKVQSRIEKAMLAGVPVTNYGIAIAKLKGILDKIKSK